MTRTVITFILLFVVLVLAQPLIFNNLILFNVALPLVFVYLIISLPVTLSTNWSVVIGFLTGLAVDIFSDTPGMNALACTILAFIRKPVYHLYMSYDDDLSGMRPSIATMGSAPYFKYMLTMVFVYCLTVFAIEAFQFFNLRLLLLRTVCSTIFTFIIIYAIDSLSFNREKKL